MGSWAMLDFRVEVTTGELVALERALRGLDTDAARSRLSPPVALETSGPAPQSTSSAIAAIIEAMSARATEDSSAFHAYSSVASRS